MANKFTAAVLVLVACGMSAAPALSQQSAAAKDGIAAYKARNYGVALSTLKSATQSSPKDEVARYYLALTYQALTRTADSEREYKWIYEHGTNKDLKYKAWQGMATLHTARPRSIASGSQNSNNNSSSANPTKLVSNKGPQTPYKCEVGEAPTSRSSFTPGCSRH